MRTVKILDPDSVFFDKTKKIPLSYIVLKDQLNNVLEQTIKVLKIKRFTTKNFML